MRAAFRLSFLHVRHGRVMRLGTGAGRTSGMPRRHSGASRGTSTSPTCGSGQGSGRQHETSAETWLDPVSVARLRGNSSPPPGLAPSSSNPSGQARRASSDGERPRGAQRHCLMGCGRGARGRYCRRTCRRAARSGRTSTCGTGTARSAPSIASFLSRFGTRQAGRPARPRPSLTARAPGEPSKIL
jgi:hypothetical protein